MKDASVLASGPLAETITTDVLSDAFGLRLRVDAHDGRYAARPGVSEPEIVAERDRSVVTCRDGVMVKRYRRARPRNAVELAAYEHLQAYPDAPVPAAGWPRPPSRSNWRTSSRW